MMYLAYTGCLSKDNKLWVFGSWKGRNYSDNSKELFKYVNEVHKDINAVWIAKNKNVYDEVKREGYKVVLYPSKEAKHLIAHARVNVQTESNEDTGRFRVGGAKIIQLFHGYGSVKEARLFARMSRIKKRIVKIYADNHAKSYWMVPSEYFVERLPIIFEADKNKLFVTGQPRIDLLLKKNKIEYFENFICEHKDSKLMFYVPTHRNYGKTQMQFIHEDDWTNLNFFLKKRNIFLFFKPHPLELPKYKTFENQSNIIIVNKIPNTDDIYEYLHYCDVLISDYSSIATDYLVLDRPIIHYMYDLDTFSSDDMYVDPDNKFICGPICKTQDELFNAIDAAITNDKYASLRKKVRDLAIKHVDTKNCERVYEKINEILNS